jgi:hypothetical protein
LKLLRGEGAIGATYEFYYPDLINTKVRRQNFPSASLEMLLGPWQIISSHVAAGGSVVQQFIVYYAGPSSTVDEFRYLIDFFFRYQMLRDDSRIRLRLRPDVPMAVVNFRKAADQTGELAFKRFRIKELEQRLKTVESSSYSAIVQFFSESELGLGNG